jgi:hypothetical protein
MPRLRLLDLLPVSSADGPSAMRCEACRHDFSVTSGTLVAWHKLPLRSYLLGASAFCNEVKGKGMPAFSRELDVQYKTVFVLAHKLREAMAASVKGLRIGGKEQMAENMPTSVLPSSRL